jgi:hypothetical protein
MVTRTKTMAFVTLFAEQTEKAEGSGISEIKILIDLPC